MELNELMRRVRFGDREALKELIARYGGQVYKRALNKTGDKTLAKEITQKTFAELVSTLQKNPDDEGWQLWLDTLASRNIDTFERMKSDVSYVERALERELYQQAPPSAAEQQLPAPTRPQPYAPRENIRQVQGSYGRSAAPIRPQQQAAVRSQQQAATRPQPTGAVKQPQRPHPPKDTPRAAPAQEPSPEKTRSGFGYGFGVCILIILCLTLLWIATGICMTMGFLPKLDLGYNWFNQNIFSFF